MYQRALPFCDHKKLSLALLGVFERREQHDMADQLFQTLLKKFKGSSKVWLRRIQNLLKRGMSDAAKSAFERALQCLPKRKHIKLISKAAFLEYKFGSEERARAMLEGVLRNYPKRTDIWNVYIDQEVKVGDIERVRGLFERAVSLDLAPKRMKFLFKKYLGFESEHGDEVHAEEVKAKAVAYVDRKTGGQGGSMNI